MSAKIHTYHLMIRESHLDTFGHVNNAVYLQILEEARWDLITENGYGLDKVRATGLGPTILEVQLRFSKELKLRQKIKVETHLKSYEKKIAYLIQEIKNEANEICASATFTFGLFDTQARKLVLPTPDWLKAIGG
jgi:thioesterase-3